MSERIVKRSVSGSPELFAAAAARMSGLLITNFSEYVRELIRRDLAGEADGKFAGSQHQRPNSGKRQPQSGAAGE
jgi:hypothetical protein